MLSKFSVKKPMTVLVCVILVIILGIVAFMRMTPDLLPNLDFPYVVVVTSYPGASPEQVETEITKPVEQSMATLDNIADIQSTSSENASILIMEFSNDANMDATTMNIRERLDQLSGSWNETVGQPYILKINPNMLPVNVSAVARDGYSTVELSAFIEETILPQLEGTEGVASISSSGMVKEELHVLFNQNSIDELNTKIRAAIDLEFVDAETEISDGRAELDDAEAKLASGRSALYRGQKELDATAAEVKAQFDSTEKSLNDNINLISQQLSLLDAESALQQQLADLQTIVDPDEAQQTQIAELEAQLMVITQLKPNRPMMEQQLSAMQDGLKELADNRKLAEEQQKAYQSEINSGSAQLVRAQNEIDAGRDQLDDAQEQLENARQEAYDAADANDFITLSTVASLLGAQNFAMPAGYVAGENDTQWLVYVGDKISTEEELENLVLLDLGMDGLEPIRVADVADVFVSDNAAETYAKLNGHDSVLLAFYKQSNYATATVSENIESAFSEIVSETEGLSFHALMDQGDYIHLVVDSVLENLGLGAILAILILLIFLMDIRPTFVVACSIPISVTFAIVLMYFSGITLNVISMSGLAVGVGMLVDNSIVVIENIFRMRSEGVSPHKAAIKGAQQVAGAIFASTLTTVCVFAPIVFVDGITRQLFTDMALTITYSLLASLIVALTLVPAMCSGTMKKRATRENRAFGWLQNGYHRILSFVLRHKVPAFILVTGLLAVSVYLSLSKGFAFMPPMDSPQMSVNVTLPEEATLDELRIVCDDVSERILSISEVETVGVMQSGGIMSMMGMGATDNSTNAATMYIVLHEDHPTDSNVLALEIEALCSDINADISVSGSTMDLSMLSGSGITVNIFGDDIEALMLAASDVGNKLLTVEGIESVSGGAEDAAPELRISINREKAIEHGLTTAQVFQEIATVLTTDATATAVDGLDVIVHTVEGKKTINDIKDHTFTIVDKQGDEKSVVLSEIASFSEAATLPSINRSLQRRYISVSASLKDGYNISHVAAACETALKEVTLPSGTRLEVSGENETIMEAMEDLALMLLLGIVIVYLIMVAQFQSLLSPFIVLLTVPLAFTGGLLALFFGDFEVSIVSMIGFVLLVGIIVNNGIVLIDCMNQLRTEGIELKEAVLQACTMRLRPVLMTALTTILGLIPLGLGFGPGASLVQPVAVVSIGGLVYATLMTLFIVPAAYEALCKKAPKLITDTDE